LRPSSSKNAMVAAGSLTRIMVWRYFMRGLIA
jgi:hypothetical protein